MTREHILLTALGKEQRATVYELNGQTAEEPLAPLALLRLLPETAKPNRVFALCTQGAKQATWETFASGLRNTPPIEAECINIPDGRTADEIRQIVEIVAEKFPEGVELTLDITQGFRHFPFVAYGLTLYLTSLRGIRLRGAYYGMLEASARDSREPRPIINLRPLLELPEWFHAVRVFRETGSTGPLAKLVSPHVARLRTEAHSAGNQPDLHKIANAAQTISRGLDHFSFAYEAALPVELGKAAVQLCESLREPPAEVSRFLPLSRQITEFVHAAIEGVAFSAPPRYKGEWKTYVAIDDRELSRQAALISQYFERRQLPLASGLLREWVVSWVLSRGGRREWWSRDERVRAEGQLGALAAAERSDLAGSLSDDQRSWAQFWQDLSDLRNTLHHHGMRKEPLDAPPTTVERIRSFWEKLREGAAELPPLGGGCGTLLITAIGNRPGVLYSALSAAPSNRLLVICSRQSAPMIDEATRRAGFDGAMRQLLVNDPHAGFHELQRVRSEAGEFLLRADQILANLTGGTTLMGFMVQQLVEAGERLSRPYRRFALIDRRPAAEQDAEPWVKSDIYWLDKSDEERDADD